MPEALGYLLSTTNGGGDMRERGVKSKWPNRKHIGKTLRTMRGTFLWRCGQASSQIRESSRLYYTTHLCKYFVKASLEWSLVSFLIGVWSTNHMDPLKHHPEHWAGFEGEKETDRKCWCVGPGRCVRGGWLSVEEPSVTEACDVPAARFFVFSIRCCKSVMRTFLAVLMNIHLVAKFRAFILNIFFLETRRCCLATFPFS